MPSEKEISDGICVPCIRLRFILTKPIGSTFFVQTAKSVVGRIPVSDIFPAPKKLVLRTSVGFENPTYAYCVVSLWVWKTK